VDGVIINDIIIRGHFINAILLTNITIIDTNCSISNETTLLQNMTFNSIGGCFRIENAYNSYFENLLIFDSFSDKTTYGITIIDDTNAFILDPTRERKASFPKLRNF